MYHIPTVLVVFTAYLSFNLTRRLLRVNPGSTPSKLFAGKLWIVLGSGGHTAEMLMLCRRLNYCHKAIVFVVAETDKTSLEQLKGVLFKQDDQNGLSSWSNIDICRIPRVREVNGNLIFGIIRLFRLWVRLAFRMIHDQPGLILCNGPGTALPVVFGAISAECLTMRITRIVFVESFCRVKTLSLTGKILLYLVDR